MLGHVWWSLWSAREMGTPVFGVVSVGFSSVRVNSFELGFSPNASFWRAWARPRPRLFPGFSASAKVASCSQIGSHMCGNTVSADSRNV